VAIAVLATLHGAQAAARSADWGSQDRLYLVDLAKSPQSARVQSNAGFIAQERGEHRRALRFFARALQIEPRYEKAYVNAGVSYAALGEWEKAIEVFGVAVDLQPWKASLHWKLAESLIAAARTEEALPHLEAAARLAPDDEEVRNALASAYEGMGHPDWAQALYRESDPRKTKPPGGAR
jgi:tetratricopeptide (TPR) repeat protein